MAPRTLTPEPMWKAGASQAVRGERPLVMAHRGRSATTPESSYQAFREAYELGVDFLETDAHLTRDGEVVLFHDSTLDRTTDGTGRLADYTLAQLEEFDMGYWFQPPGLEGTGEYPFRGKGVKVVTLDEVLKSFPDVRVNVDLKDPFRELPGHVAGVLRDNDAEGRVIVGSFRQKQIRRFREVAPRVATSAGPAEVLKFYLGHKLGRLSGGARPYIALQVPVKLGPLSVVNPATIRKAHERGVAVQPWVVNDPVQMAALLEWGVDGIFTDVPEVLLEQVTRFVEGGDE
ncbi:MAG: glycerophosphodiester phosphodiesterase [Promethearchaeota archaeon]